MSTFGYNKQRFDITTMIYYTTIMYVKEKHRKLNHIYIHFVFNFARDEIPATARYRSLETHKPEPI